MKESLQEATQRTLLEGYKNLKENKDIKTEKVKYKIPEYNGTYTDYEISIKLKDGSVVKEILPVWDSAEPETYIKDTYTNMVGMEDSEILDFKPVNENKSVKEEAYNYNWRDDIEEVENTEENDELVYNIAEHKALINEYGNLSTTGNKLNMITESKKMESDNDEEHEILIKFWETEEDRDLGESDIYKYFDISELKHAISVARDLLFDMNYASIEVQDAETYETYYFTDGEEEEYFGIAKDLKESKKVEDYSYYWKDDIEEVENTEENDELVYNVAEHMKETQPEEYAEEDVWDIASNIIHLWKIAKRSRLYDYLIKWYGSEQEMLNKVRDVYETRDAIYFVTGSGYSLFDADLLGGNADGRTQDAFSKFVANGGKKVENIEVESKKVETYSYYWKDDIDEIEDDDIWYDVAENIKNTDPDYADWDVIEIMSDIICVWGIQKRTRLYDYLLKWYGSEEELLKNVRDVLDTNDAIYFVTGMGYSIWSADLLGGTADGLAERDFTRFVDNGGKKEDTKEN